MWSKRMDAEKCKWKCYLVRNFYAGKRIICGNIWQLQIKILYLLHIWIASFWLVKFLCRKENYMCNFFLLNSNAKMQNMAQKYRRRMYILKNKKNNSFF
jgi:hypothetical protein